METDGRTYGRTDVRTDGQDLESLGKAGPSRVRQKKVFWGIHKATESKRKHNEEP